MRILIADDDPTSREIARLLIARAGHQIDAVGDGAAALDAILRAEYAIALLDVQMPCLDGAEVARAARAALPDGRRPRLVAFTAGFGAAADRGLLALGFDACLPKPIRQAALDAILEGAAPPPPPIAAPPPGAPAPALAGAVALLSAPAATLETLGGAAAALKAEALAAEQLALAGLCARLESAAAARDQPAAAELAASIVALLG